MKSTSDAHRDPALERTLLQALKGTRIGHPLYAFKSVSSTMDVARRVMIEDAAPEGTLIWAATQKRGRGRLGRVWASPQGGIYCSIILRPSRCPLEIPQLALVAGLSSAKAIHEATGLFPSIRWPNDILLHQRKVCGILVEAVSGAAIVGIGINVTTHPEDLPENALSLASGLLKKPRDTQAAQKGADARSSSIWLMRRTGRYADEAVRQATQQMRLFQQPARVGAQVDPCALTGVLCRHFDVWYDLWSAQGFASLRESLRSWMAGMGEPVQITAGSTKTSGITSDVDESGRLLVRLDSGLVQAFEMGEVTLLR